MAGAGHRTIRRLLIALAVALTLAVGVGIGYLIPHKLSPSERVAPRSEDVTTSLQVNTVFRVATSEKLVALTFDDGPDARWTPTVLDILAKHDAKATFFVIGEAAKKHPELIAREAAEGHEIGIHEWQHVDYLNQEFSDLSKRLRDTREAIIAAGAPEPTLGRPPYGRLDSPALRAYADLSLDAVLWSHHFPGAHAAEVRHRNVESASPGMIVLAHDGRGDPTDALMSEIDTFISALKAKGYRFVTISELREHAEKTAN